MPGEGNSKPLQYSLLSEPPGKPPNPLQYSYLEIPWTEESGGLQSMGSGIAGAVGGGAESLSFV